MNSRILEWTAGFVEIAKESWESFCPAGKRRPSYLRSKYKGPRNPARNARSFKTALAASLSAALLCIAAGLGIGGREKAGEQAEYVRIAWNWTGGLRQAGSAIAGTAEEAEMPILLSDPEYELLVRLVTAEAEDQEPQAQYMIACVVMNRVKSPLFPDTVEEVIWQNEPVEQFTSMWNGRFERCISTKECRRAVDFLIEHGNQLPEDVLYFTSDGYLPGTEPYMQVDEIYFSRQGKKV